MTFNKTKSAPKVRLSKYKGYRITTNARRGKVIYKRGKNVGSKWEWWWHVIGLGNFKTLAAAKNAINKHLKARKSY